MGSLRSGTVCALTGVLMAVAAAADAQESARCAAAEYRQFDFWLGDWDVQNPQGQQVGTNSITSIYGGCALEERWQSAGQHAGASFNAYDAARQRWHQTWVDNEGLLLQLDGGLEGGKMVLRGESVGQDGRAIVNRITWAVVAPDRVRQLWETSRDGGSTWQVAFDGLYIKRSGR